MNAGIYEHKGHRGNYYLLIGLARDHHSDEEFIVYVPLRIEPEWSGTARMAIRPARDFERTFEWVGDVLP